MKSLKNNLTIIKRIIKITSLDLIVLCLMNIGLNIGRLILVPLLAYKIFYGSLIDTAIFLILYFFLNYSSILLKKHMQNISNESRISRIEESFFGCLSIDYEYFESKEGQNLFNKAVGTTNSSNSPFSNVYIHFCDSLYNSIYMLLFFIMYFYFVKEINISFLFVILIFFIIFYESRLFLKMDKDALNIFIEKDKKFRYLKKVSNSFNLSSVLRLYGSENLIENKYIRNINEVNKSIDLSKNRNISHIFILNLGKIFSLAIFVLLNREVLDILFIGFLQILLVAEKFFISMFDLSNDFEKLKYYIEFIEKSKDKGNREIEIKKIDSLEFKNVSFSYGKSGFSLDNVSFRLDKNKKIGIFGLNGSGKTTITKLILGLYKPSFGEILINGININRIKNIDQVISCIFQSDTLIPASIEDNIVFGKEYNRDLLDTSLKKSHFDEVMKKK